MMNKILHRLEGVKCYRHDIIVFGPDEEHDKNLKSVFTCIDAAGMKLNEKCKFHLTSLEYW